MNGSHSHVLKGLTEGLAYKVRVVARDHDNRTLHHSEEVLVKVPGEASLQPPPQGLVGNVRVVHGGRVIVMSLKRLACRVVLCKSIVAC